MFTCEVDTKGLNDVISGLSEALIGAGQKGDAATLVEDECRRFLKQTVKFTPSKSAPQGRKAVRRDITRAMRPLAASGDEESSVASPDLMFTRNKKLHDRFQLLVNRKDIQALNAILKNQPGNWKKWRVHPFNRELHRKSRVGRGRVAILRRDFVLGAKEWNQYVRHEEAKVGRKKAAWGESYVLHGGKVSSFISRHFPTPKAIHMSALVGEQPSIAVGSAAPDVKTESSKIQGALRARREAIIKRTKLVLSGYAKDVAAGMRPKRKVTPSIDGEVVE